MPNQEISLARIPIRTGTQRNDLVFYNMYFWKTSPIGIGIWDIFHFSEIRLGLCNTWWMCSHEMLKKCLCWQRSGFKAFIMLCKMKKNQDCTCSKNMAHVIIIIISERGVLLCRATYLDMFLILLYHSWFYHIIQAKD